MNTNKIFGIAVAVILTGMLAGCSLDANEPQGSTVTQRQYEDNMFSSEAHIRGLYKIMIEYSDHDEFGQKSIDIKTDMISSDMALTNVIYGWFADCGRLQASHANSYFTHYVWNYYYTIIKNCNLIIATKGDAERLENPTTMEEQIKANYIGQAYAMRGLSYYSLSYYYSHNQKATVADNLLVNKCVPIYDENTSDVEAQQLATVEQVLNQAEGDLVSAITYLKNYNRESLTMIDKDVAKTMLAYLYLYRARLYGRAEGNETEKNTDANDALTLCDEVIATGKYPILPFAEVTTTGFNSVSSKNWMWGQDITAETATGLGTFWGQVDIYTYSYAWAGDVKAIDNNLYADLKKHTTDERIKWWTESNKLAPTGKFYDSAKKLGGDRLWLNDIVFMRSEELYLIAAEAAYIKQDYTAAQSYLKVLLEQRDPARAAALPANADIEDEIYFNWRIEMWGEGKAYFTMQRFDKSRTRGSNHYYYNSGEVIAAYDERVCFEIPSTEIKYNPHLFE